MTESFYRDILYESPNGYALYEILLDKNGKPYDYKFIEINPAFEKFTGLLAKDIIGKTILETIPFIVEDKFDWIAFFGDIANNNKKEEFESFSETLDRWYKVKVFSPKKNFFVTIFYDKTIEMETLIKEKLFLNTTLHSIADGVISTNEFGEITLMNNIAEQLTGFSKEEAVGKKIEDVFSIYSQDTGLSCDNIVEKVIHTGAIQELANHTILRSKDGKERPIADSAAPIVLNDGTFSGVVLVFRDYTEKYQAKKVLVAEKELFQNYLDVAGVMLIVINTQGEITNINQKGCHIIGLSEDEIIGKNWFDNFIPKDDVKEIKNVFNDLINGQSEFISHYENPIINAKGEKRYISWNNTLLRDAKNNIIGLLASGEDITDRKRYEEELFKSESNLKLAQSIAKVGSWELELNTNQVWGSEEAFKIYELDRTSEYLDYDITRNMIDDSDRIKHTQALNELINDNKPYDITFKIVLRKGKVKYINSKANLVFDKDNKPFKVIGIIHDITELTNKNLELEYASNHDFLTGLYNRRYFVESYKKLDQPKYYPLGVLMLDVNGLKIINDAYGHGLGDIALQKVSDTLQHLCRKDDIICRIGGDEFAIILSNVSKDELESFKTNIQETSKNEKVNNINLSVAIGYEIKDKDIEGNLDDILKLAENHMYRHKITINISVRNNAIKAILKTLTDKYEEEKIHSARVSQLCKQMGEELDLNAEDIKELEMAGMYHDIGKISIPDAILNKPDRLTKEEFEVIKTHPEVSYQILRAADEYSDLAIHALYHHERWDGLGYPSGLKGENIPLFSRIICIADAYEAMTTVRSYKKQMSQDEAVIEIIKCSGSQFDEKLARVFVEKVLHKKWKLTV